MALISQCFLDPGQGGVSNKDAVIAACEQAMLDHIQKLMGTALSLPDIEAAQRFEKGLRRTRRLDRVMRDIVNKVYQEDPPHG